MLSDESDPFQSIAARPLALHFVCATGTTETVACACGHETPRRARLALPDSNVPLPGGQLAFDEARPEKCAECVAAKAKPGIALCGTCMSTIVPGQLVCIGQGVPKYPDVATYVGGTPETPGPDSAFLICTDCSPGIDAFAGHWVGDGIQPVG